MSNGPSEHPSQSDGHNTFRARWPGTRKAPAKLCDAPGCTLQRRSSWWLFAPQPCWLESPQHEVHVGAWREKATEMLISRPETADPEGESKLECPESWPRTGPRAWGLCHLRVQAPQRQPTVTLRLRHTHTQTRRGQYAWFRTKCSTWHQRPERRSLSLQGRGWPGTNSTV